MINPISCLVRFVHQFHWLFQCLMVGAGLPVVAFAQMLNLGAAAGYAGLELTAAPVSFDLSKISSVVNGNIGIVAGGVFNFSGGAEISGGIYGGVGAQINLSGGSSATDGVHVPFAGIPQAVTDAQNAANYYAGLTPNHTLASLGSTTLAGSGGMNVYQITGNFALDRNSLTLSGTASDVFVFNIYGQINFSRSSIVLNGVSPDAVLFNMIGSGQKMVSTGHSDTMGVFLAQNGAIQIDGGVHVSNFISGDSLIWQSGVNITQATSPTVVPVPEAGTVATLVISLGAVGALTYARRRRAPDVLPTV